MGIGHRDKAREGRIEGEGGGWGLLGTAPHFRLYQVPTTGKVCTQLAYAQRRPEHTHLLVVHQMVTSAEGFFLYSTSCKHPHEPTYWPHHLGLHRGAPLRSCSYGSAYGGARCCLVEAVCAPALPCASDPWLSPSLKLHLTVLLAHEVCYGVRALEHK